VPSAAADTMAAACMALELSAPLCPMCAQEITAKSTRARHLALCCPDLIDPNGWRAGDGDVVLRFAAARHPKGRSGGPFCRLGSGGAIRNTTKLSRKVNKGAPYK
jgi:hypothetical protein